MLALGCYIYQRQLYQRCHNLINRNQNNKQIFQPVMSYRKYDSRMLQQSINQCVYNFAEGTVGGRRLQCCRHCGEWLGTDVDGRSSCLWSREWNSRRRSLPQHQYTAPAWWPIQRRHRLPTECCTRWFQRMHQEPHTQWTGVFCQSDHKIYHMFIIRLS